MKKYFLVKSKIEGVNEKGKVVKLSEQNLVQALDVKDAESVFRAAIKDTVLEGSDITSISETKIVDVFNYKAESSVNPYANVNNPPLK